MGLTQKNLALTMDGENLQDLGENLQDLAGCRG